MDSMDCAQQHASTCQTALLSLSFDFNRQSHDPCLAPACQSAAWARPGRVACRAQRWPSLWGHADVAGQVRQRSLRTRQCSHGCKPGMLCMLRTVGQGVLVHLHMPAHACAAGPESGQHGDEGWALQPS